MTLTLTVSPMSMSLPIVPSPHGRLCHGRWISVWIPHGASEEACTTIAQKKAPARVPSCPRPSKSKSFVERCRPRPTSKPMDWNWKNSSDWPWSWSNWTSESKENSKDWIRDEIYEEIEIETEEFGLQPDDAEPDWFDEKTEDLSENGKLVKSTQEVLQRYLGVVPVHRSGKRGRSPSPQELQPNPPPKRSRKGRGGKAFSKRAKLDDDKQILTKIDVRTLRYSQLSIKKTFQCGLPVAQLVQDLKDGTVSLSEPFLRLSVFETRDKKTKKRMLRCIDNRRLFALKEYAKDSGKDRVMVNVNLFSNHTVMEVRRFIQNSDDTDGRSVRLRSGNTMSRRKG